MYAMRILQRGRQLELASVPAPVPGPGQLLLRVSTCGVCRTDLHLLDGELPQARYPIVPGHEIVGRVSALGPGATRFSVGARLGVPWLAGSCGECDYCREGRENLCAAARYTGCHVDGGYAEYAVADERYCLALPNRYSDRDAAPLLCAGLIGYRAYGAAGEARRLGLHGFGAAAHLLAQLAIAEDREIYAFTRPGDLIAQQFARELGAKWAGGSDERAPAELDAAIVFAPVGSLIPRALAGVRRGGRVVCAGIHMSDIPSFPYALLWQERSLCSVANLTREDGARYMQRLQTQQLRPRVKPFALADANHALEQLRHGQLSGAAVLVCDEPSPV